MPTLCPKTAGEALRSLEFGCRQRTYRFAQQNWIPRISACGKTVFAPCSRQSTSLITNGHFTVRSSALKIAADKQPVPLLGLLVRENASTNDSLES